MRWTSIKILHISWKTRRIITRGGLLTAAKAHQDQPRGQLEEEKWPLEELAYIFSLSKKLLWQACFLHFI